MKALFKKVVSIFKESDRGSGSLQARSRPQCLKKKTWRDG